MNSDEAVLQAEAYCRQHGLRMTEFRRKVLKMIWDSPKALSPQDIIHGLRKHQPPMTYRTLEFLMEHGFIHHVCTLNAYVGSQHIGMNHGSQLFICMDCHGVKEIDERFPHIENMAVEEDFKINHLQLEVLGLCKDCHNLHTNNV